MNLIPALTHVGLLALQSARAGGPAVTLSRIKLGTTARLPSGNETDVLTAVADAPIASHTLDPVSGQLDLCVMIDGGEIGLTQDHVIHEAGVFDQDGRLIFYWAGLDSIGSITPVTAYALNVAMTLAQADAAVIQIVDVGAPWDAILEPRLQAIAAVNRRAAWRTLFLALSN